MSRHIILQNLEERMEQACTFFKKDMQSIRTGRVHSNMLDNITVETPYGSSIRLRELATWNILERRKLCLTLFDPSIAAAVAGSLDKGDIGLRVSLEGTSIILTAPELDEQVRKDTVKLCKKKAENARISMRSLRKDANNSLRNAELSEDQVRRMEKDVQKLTDCFCKEIDKLLAEKETELLAV